MSGSIHCSFPLALQSVNSKTAAGDVALVSGPGLKSVLSVLSIWPRGGRKYQILYCKEVDFMGRIPNSSSIDTFELVGHRSEDSAYDWTKLKIHSVDIS